mmetsp:Transcript_28627/g.80727  ORF Transcript_28627/g.80727 Transcript_28627/m.80727 type:complete len:1220 (+) Transcript_28627:235-3894(+)
MDAPAVDGEEEDTIIMEQQKALREAEKCLQQLQHEEFLLDGFNLLGIVANPGGTMIQNSQHPPSRPPSSQQPANQQQDQSQQQQQPTSSQVPGSSSPDSATAATVQGSDPLGAAATQNGAAGNHAATAAADASAASYYSEYFTGTVTSLEQTLGQVTEQIDTLNMFLEELSREYLGEYGDETTNLEYYLSQEEEEEELDLSGIPKELAHIIANTQALKRYLAESGELATTLKTTPLRPSPHVLPNPDMPHIAMAHTAADIDDSASTIAEKVDALMSQLPPIIIQPDFDLTDPITFSKLVMDGERGESTEIPNVPSLAKRKMTKKESILQPTSELVPAANPDYLTQYLDKVELALLEQVREKSGAFFQETTRFRQLSTSVVALLGQTSQLRRVVQSVLESYTGVGDIPSLDEARGQLNILHDVLEQIVELLNVKGSIGGFVSANDQFGAAEQIQYGQRLLMGAPSRADAARAEQSAENGSKAGIVLRLDQLNALQSCGDQFKQYQSLVVQNLSEEITEAFLGWKTPPPGRALPDGMSRVTKMMEALKMCDSLESAGQIYLKRINQTLRMTVRTTIAEFVDSNKNDSKNGGSGVTGMTYTSFSKCLDLLLEELLGILLTAHSVDTFCVTQNIFNASSTTEAAVQTSDTSNDGKGKENGKSKAPVRWTFDAVSTSVEQASEDIAKILRLRKEAHSLISLDDMRQLWDRCLQFVGKIEKLSSTRAVSLRSTLIGQAKAFLERTHVAKMSALAAALDSERWTQCEVSAERQDSLTRLCSGRAVFSSSQRRRTTDDLSQTTASTVVAPLGLTATTAAAVTAKQPTAVVEGTSYKVVWSCLLLVEMVMTNLAAAAHFQMLATNAVGKVAELLRLFNARATHLVLGAGAIHSAARLKSINAKHLSLVTQSLGMMLSLFPHIRAALMAQLPTKQHTLLNDLDTIRGEYVEHNEKVMNKFVTIIGGIVEHGLAPRIANTNFDGRGRDLPERSEDGKPLACCVFFDGVVTNTRKMHQVLSNLLPPDHLQDVFSRIFAYVDQKLPALLIAADSASVAKAPPANGTVAAPRFTFPQTDAGKRRLLLELEHVTVSLNKLPGVLSWDFSAVSVIERRIDYRLNDEVETTNDSAGANEAEEGTDEQEGDDQQEPQGGPEPTNGHNGASKAGPSSFDDTAVDVDANAKPSGDDGGENGNHGDDGNENATEESGGENKTQVTEQKEDNASAQSDEHK